MAPASEAAAASAAEVASAQPAAKSAFVFDAACHARLSAILAQYQGTHNFSNFTPAVTAGQAAAKRCADLTPHRNQRCLRSSLVRHGCHAASCTPT